MIGLGPHFGSTSQSSFRMKEIFSFTSKPDPNVFYDRGDKNDPRLGEIVGREEIDYEQAEIVILGCPQDIGVRARNGRVGAAKAPAAIREQLYKLTPFGIRKRLFDIGDLKIGATLEETHENQLELVTKLLKDNKRVIVIGGGGDIAYPDGIAMAKAFGRENWIAVSIDAELDVQIAEMRHSGTAYRQLLEEKHLRPDYFYEAGFQSHLTSPIYYEYVRALGVNRISLELLRSRAEADLELKESIKLKFIGHSTSLNTFFGFDMGAVRSADAPGTSYPSPLGLRAGEFIQLVKYAASLANTKLIEFSEFNPKYDADDRTSKLVAVAIHRFCAGVA